MKVFRRSRFVMVTKLVMTTSSAGIIIIERKMVNTRSLPLNCSREKAKAARIVTTSISSVVMMV